MGGRVRNLAIGLALATAAVAGCAGGAWQTALREDSPAAYARFLRDHPGSPYADEARIHIEFLRVKRRPSFDALASFRERFPGSPLLAELQPMLEQQAFDAARAQGSAEAYRDFAAEFADTGLAARALGNAAYVSSPDLQGDPAALLRFAEDHPESDFAAEARHSGVALELRDRTRFARVGLSVEVSASTAEADRVASALRERAMARYRAAGIVLVPIPEMRLDAEDARIPAARLRIQHREESVALGLADDQLWPPAVVARTVVSLRIGEDGPPIWEREFSLETNQSDLRGGASPLFGPHAARYWDAFFVPVASWQSNASIRALVNLAKPVTAVDSLGSQVVVLFEDGDFQVLELSDPSRPVVLAEYRREHRPREFSRWTGVRFFGDHFALFGDDGVLWVRSDDSGRWVTRALGRGEVGSIVAVEAVGDSLVLAGKRGLSLVKADASAPALLLRRDVRGLAKIGDGLIFSDGESLFLSTLPLLRAGRVRAQLRLGRGFAPGRIRAFASTAIVIGDAGVLVLDTQDPLHPRATAQLYTRQVGRVVDAGIAAGRIFLLGDRGLQVLEPSLRRVEDSVDVAVREQVAVFGRHVALAGASGLQVVDATPFGVVAAEAASTEGW